MSCSRSCCACSRRASSSGSARRRRAGQRADHLGDQCRPQRRGRGRAIPAGPAFPAEHDRDSSAAAARSARRHSAAGEALPAAARAALSQARSPASIPAAMQTLLDHRWPGNMRELDHAVERAVLMAQGPTIRTGDLGLRVDGGATARIEDMSLEEVEGVPDQEGHGPLRQCQPGRQGPRPVRRARSIGACSGTACKVRVPDRRDWSGSRKLARC